MAGTKELINFDVIENQKENIQSLPGGRSAMKLAKIFSPTHHQLAAVTPTDARNVNDCIRAEYEAEIESMSEADDPLDVFDRYVRWTLDTYPSAQATPQSQLHLVLERATKSFISSPQYKNDPRYLRMWMLYIHLFSDSPREAYMFLSRHEIGGGLALFYEEYAAWLEGAGRWTQAEEVYKIGINRGARPVQRLLRKSKEFEQRLAQQPDALTGPSSPALPTIRPALAAKMEPFGAVSRPVGPQDLGPNSVVGGTASMPSKLKLAIFSDADAQPSAFSSRNKGTMGWDTIGFLADRKKENAIEPKPWAGETLKAGSKKSAASKIAVFRDTSLSQIQNIVVVPSKHQVTVHSQTGKKEYIFVDLTKVYPTPEEFGTELSFEEIIAANRGWLDLSWANESVYEGVNSASKISLDEIGHIKIEEAENSVLHHDAAFDENGAAKEWSGEARGGRKKKIMEVNETQIIKAKLDSPFSPKIRKKNMPEPTMTLHTKAATDDIYDIFNAPLRTNPSDIDETGVDGYETDSDYTTDGESTATTRQVDPSELEDDQTSNVKSINEWSNFSARKSILGYAAVGDEGEANETRVSDRVDTAVSSQDSDSVTEQLLFPQNQPELPGTVESPPCTRTLFIPIPPEDYEPPTRPYRDPSEVANNRLPFMTPITERTESSLDVDVERTEQFKTPCKRDNSSTLIDVQSDSELLSSPLREVLTEEKYPLKPLVSKAAVALRKYEFNKSAAFKGHIIKDVQCSPVDEAVRQEILANIQPPLAAYPDFHDRRQERFCRGGEIRKCVKALKTGKGGTNRTGLLTSPFFIEFPHTSSKYCLKRELGAGAFAPVYLVEKLTFNRVEDYQENAVQAVDKGPSAVGHQTVVEALKMESPPTSWEFYMMRVAHSRLGPQNRATVSIPYAHELHLYQDETFLFLPYYPHGTLLDVVNLFRAEPSGVMDEQLAMFFTIELMRTVEALHSNGILHGDLKADNCLLRLDAMSTPGASDQTLSSQWYADGGGGWASRGVVLIDFGRSIDMRAFVLDVEFVADWKTSTQDCPEMREGRPWTWQIDYYGLAGIIHCLLFGKYIETVRCDRGGLDHTGRKYKIRESLKRYWQTDIWSDCFEQLLNPGSFIDSEDGGKMPLLKSMSGVRKRMESWLAANSDRGAGLKSAMTRIESFVNSRK